MSKDSEPENDNLVSQILAKAANLAGVEPDKIDRSASLDSLGLESMDAIILAMEVEEVVGREIEPGIFLKFDTIGEACDKLKKILG